LYVFIITRMCAACFSRLSLLGWNTLTILYEQCSI
jgi:hypothetical protein